MDEIRIRACADIGRIYNSTVSSNRSRHLAHFLAGLGCPAGLSLKEARIRFHPDRVKDCPAGGDGRAGEARREERVRYEEIFKVLGKFS